VCPRGVRVGPSVTSIEKRGKWDDGCLAGARGGRDTDARQQKSKEGDATSDLLLKHPDASLAIYV
jgi:hypothetical protein